MRFKSLLVLVMLSIVAVAVYRSRVALRTPGSNNGDGPKTPDAAPVVARLPRPPAPTEGFVGSNACRECHPKVVDEYLSTHPMARSMQEIGAGDPTQATIRVEPEGSDRYYQIKQDASGVWHHETVRDSESDALPLSDIKYQVRFGIGSSVRGRTYLLQRGERLFQSPISWYEHGQQWDLAPGYHAKGHARFDRLMGESCLACHAGRMNTLHPGDNRYDPQTPFAEISIGCERCHGPGQPHIDFRRQLAASQGAKAAALEAEADLAAIDGVGGADPIVNPAKLPPSLRDSVCNQCHLQGDAVVRRYGREFGDFRPGDHLANHQSTFVHSDEHAWDTVAQYLQMVSSRCYRESNGALGCISCHDPHSKPSAEQREPHFNQRCQTCHAASANSVCSLSAEQQQAKGGSCIACHMPRGAAFDVPHTAATDHRVPRRPEDATESAKDQSAPSEMVDIDSTTLIGADEVDMSPRERRRALGLARMTQVRLTQNRSEALLAVDELSPAADFAESLNALHDDYVALEALGLAYALTMQETRAEQCWLQVLQHRPDYDPVHRFLAQMYSGRRDLSRALQHLEQYLNRNEHEADMQFFKAMLLSDMGDIRGAVAAAEHASRLDPAKLQFHRWLAEVYTTMEDTTRARRHQRFIEQLERTLGRR
ncbi:MAG: hypothetical protein KDB14_23160 [Planctomycetales bacterium]|nr:hypothetical protein [Planctomycetales bacterium]